MISNIAHWCLLISMFSSSSAIILSLADKPKLALHLVKAQAISITASFICLIIAFYTSDFSIQNVFLNSSSIMPVIFRISAAWASHEGSQLLWFSFLCIISYLCIKNISYNDTLAKAAILIISPIMLALCLFIYFAANPFSTLYLNPHQGLGLNPILQDAALAIHPPILYLGYVSFLAPLIYSCLVLIYPKNLKELLEATVKFSKFGWMMLTIGIALGSWWAYRELGWGGYWFFDPVENISLIPLIMGIAFHHSLIFSIHNQKLLRWTIFFGLNIFPVTLIGSFLVRSGALISVHSFADANYTECLLLIVTGIFCFSNGLFILRFISIPSPSLFPKSKEQGIFFGNILWLLSAITIIFSIIYPLILKTMGHDITVQVEYFTNTFIPLLIPIILLAGSFAYFKAKNTSYRDYYFSLILALIACGIIYLRFRIHGFLLYLILFSSIFLLFSTVFKLLEKTQYLSIALSNKMSSMLIGHFGFGLLAFSISLNSALSSEIDFIGKIGHKVTTKEYSITLKNINFGQEENYYKQIVEFQIEPNKGKIIILKPENRLYKVEQALTAESAIYSYLTHDVYAILNKINDDIIHAKIYYRPLISWIWLSATIIAIGILVSLCKRK